jgi:DNA-binding NarL/FixJ family response regulator
LGPAGSDQIEDHPVFRAGLTTIIGSEPDMLLVGQAANAAEGRVDVDFDLARLLIRRETGCDYVQFILPDWDDGKVEDTLYIAGCDGLTKIASYRIDFPSHSLH